MRLFGKVVSAILSDFIKSYNHDLYLMVLYGTIKTNIFKKSSAIENKLCK